MIRLITIRYNIDKFKTISHYRVTNKKKKHVSNEYIYYMGCTTTVQQ